MKNIKAADSTAAASNILASNNTATSDILQARINEAKNFFDLLYANIKERKYGYLWTKQDKITYSFDVSSADNRAAMARQAIEFNDKGQDVYFGVCLVDAPLPANKRAKEGERQPTVQTAIWTDIDVAGPTHKPQENKNLAPDFQTAKSLLPFKTSIIIDSGGGLHGYNLLSEPLAITNDNLQTAKARNKNYLETMRAKTTYKVDSVDDLERILRVPGTYNFKAGRDNAPLCRIVEVNDVRYSTDEIDKIIQSLISKNDSSCDLGDLVHHTEQPRKTTPKYFDDDPEYETARIKCALDFVFPPTDYNAWLNILMALHSAGISADVAEEWSSRDPSNYKRGEATEKFNSFTGDGGITIATLFDIAKQNGYDAKEFKREWYNSNKSARSHSAENNPDEEVADNSIIGLLKAEKFKEVNVLAHKTIDLFLAKDEIILDDIYNDNVLYSAGYFIVNATTNIEHQLLTKKFREKCKRITQLTGEGGLDETVERYAREIQTIDAERNRKIDAQKQQEHLEKLRRQAELATQKKYPLPIQKIVMPYKYQIDVENQCTVALKGSIIETVFNSVSLITKRIKNISTGVEKLEIATLKSTNKQWSYVTVERASIASTRKIVELSSLGVDVNSLNASDMVDYFNQFEVLNAQIIKDVKEVNQAGWLDDNNFILPNANDDYVIDNSKNAFTDAIKQKGNFNIWLDVLKEVRKYPLARFIVDAAIASPLLNILNERCFSIYVYGDSKAGKTATMKFGGSSWGNPNDIAKSFNCTQNGIEVAAAMRSDFVMIMNEKQLAEESNKRNRLDLTRFLYLIGEGTGKTTMDRNRNERKAYQWRIICLANGETSIIDNATTQGAITRSLIFNLEDKLLPHELSRKLHQNMHLHYGHAGKCFIDNLLNENFDELRSNFNTIVERLSKLFENHIEEHIRYTCVVALADFLIQKYFYHINEETAMSDALKLAATVIQKLKTADELSDVQNEISFLSNWIVENKNHFVGTLEHLDAKHLTVFGEEDEEYFYITVKAFKDACDSQTINYKKAIRDLRKAGCAISHNDTNTVSHRLSGTVTKCVKIAKSRLE